MKNLYDKGKFNSLILKNIIILDDVYEEMARQFDFIKEDIKCLNEN